MATRCLLKLSQSPMPVAQQIVRNIRSTSVTPPRIRIPFAEKVLHGVLITVGVTFIPAWVVFHLDDYRNKK